MCLMTVRLKNSQQTEKLRHMQGRYPTQDFRQRITSGDKCMLRSAARKPPTHAPNRRRMAKQKNEVSYNDLSRRSQLSHPMRSRNVRNSSSNYRAYQRPYAAKLSCAVMGEASERILPPLLSEQSKKLEF